MTQHWVTPEYPCRDCGVNTIPLGGEREYYEVLDSVWFSAGAPGIGQSDNGVNGFYLCIGCLEGRLNRKLTSFDFKVLPVNVPSPWYTDRLNNRLGGVVVGTKETRAHYHPNDMYEHPDCISPTGSITLPRRMNEAFGAG